MSFSGTDWSRDRPCSNATAIETRSECQNAEEGCKIVGVVLTLPPSAMVGGNRWYYCCYCYCLGARGQDRTGQDSHETAAETRRRTDDERHRQALIVRQRELQGYGKAERRDRIRAITSSLHSQSTLLLFRAMPTTPSGIQFCIQFVVRLRASQAPDSFATTADRVCVSNASPGLLQ